MPVPWRRLVNDFVSQSEIARKSIKKSLFWRSRSSKVIEFDANQKPVYDFLLVINSNLGLISHRYWDTASYRPKIANFDHPLSFSDLVRGDPLRIYEKSFTVAETRVFRAADGEDLEILAWTVFAWFTRVTDRQTDRIAMAKTRWKHSCFRA